MSIGAILIGVALFVVAIPVLASPWLRGRRYQPGPVSSSTAPLTADERRREILLALRDLEFDHATGKVASDDYVMLRAQLLQEFARYMDEQEEDLDALIERAVQEKKKGRSCAHCGAPLREGARFCPMCGAPVRAERSCPQCGVVVTLKARFCPACGAAMAAALNEVRI